MSRFPQIIENGKTGYIALNSDIGLDILIQELYGNVSEAKVSNERISSDRIKQEIERWVLSFETNPDIISERQAAVSYALENPDFISVIDHSLERIIKMKPFLKRAYTVNGALKYNQLEDKIEGQLHLLREKSREEEVFQMVFKSDGL